MISDLKSYPKYKETGLPWLGQVPEHWTIKRGKSYLTTVDKRSQSGHEELLTVSSARGVVPRRSASVTMFKAKSYAGHKLCWPGNLVINSLWAWGGGLGVSSHHGIVSTAYSVYRGRPSTQINPRYLHELVRSAAFQWELQVRSKGVWISRLQLTDTAFLDAPLPLPPPDEQAAVVRFLDWANGRLERAIRAKRRVIALLSEQRQAIIHRAVTRGLDPNAPLIPSGIPWLGDIPAHWEARQLRHIGRLYKGIGGSKEDATSDGVPCIRYGELYSHYRNFIREPRGFVSEATATSYSSIRFGDVLFAASGERVEEIGKSAVNLYTGVAVCGGDVVIFRPSIAVIPAFLGYSLDSYGAAYQKATMCRGTTIKHIYPDELRSLWTCIPPISEQESIAAELDRVLSGSNGAISRLEREISLLREYRTRLVADVVTGKLDVREVGARLPDEAPIDAAEDDADLTDEPDLAEEELEE